jgi:cell pole-organizing protein PopZ
VSRKNLGPPKGAEQTRQAILGQRFHNPGSDDVTVAPETQTPASHPPHTRVQRREPPGMTRRTYYLPESAADALDDAVAKVQAATGGRTSKHEALAALITAGAAQADAIADDLRAALLRELTGGT